MGSPRSDAARHAHESSPWMLAPMACLMFLCLAAAVFPQADRATVPGIFDLVLGRDAVRLPGSGAVAGGAVDSWSHQRLDRDRARRGVAAIVAFTRKGAKAKGTDLGLRIPRRRRNACNTPGRRSRK